MNNSRARKRAIRRLSDQHDLPYSVAARRVRLGGTPGDQGRTVYPSTSDAYRRRTIAVREARPFGERVRDTRLAAAIPDGRARHLAERFPPTRGEAGTGVGGLYHGKHRVRTLASLYAHILQQQADCVPSAGDLAWAAELGEETAVDSVCFALDRAARLHADDNRTELAGARQILDALLTIADDGHAPGTRVRLLDGGQLATILNACWDLAGPPTGYVIRVDGTAGTVRTFPRELVVLSPAEPY